MATPKKSPRARLRARIEAANTGRDPERLAMKYSKMRADAHTFLRGTAALFYSQLHLPRALRAAPLAWICGDLHLENFGAFLGGNRLVYFDINDFDEATLAPCSWDLLRLLTSLELASDAHRRSAKARREQRGMFLDSYMLALRSGKARWVERRVARGPIRRLLKRAANRSQHDLLAERAQQVKGGWRLLVNGKRALPLHKSDRARVRTLSRAALTGSDGAPAMRLVDSARRIAGTASLGLERYVVLARLRSDPNLYRLLDIKAARPPSLPSNPRAPAWSCPAARIVAIQQLLQAAAPQPLLAAELANSSFVVRELQPQQDRIAAAALFESDRDLHGFLQDIGAIVAWSHLRGAARWGAASVDEMTAFAARSGWRAALERNSLQAAQTMRVLHRDFCKLKLP